MNKGIYLMLTLAVLTGCTTTPIVNKITTPKIPTSLLEPCKAPAAPASSEYREADEHGKIVILYNLAIELYGVIAKCNTKLNTIKTREEKILNVVESGSSR